MTKCQELGSPNAPSEEVFPLHIHYENNLNILNSLATYWSRSPQVHRWFEYNIEAPWLQAARRSLYSKDDLIAIVLELSCSLDCNSRVHAPIANNNLLLIV